MILTSKLELGRTFMLFCGAGDAHGRLDRMYAEILAFEENLGARFNAVLHVGDFGIWPDPNAIDRATKEHDGAGDFPAWFKAKNKAPRLTYFIKGNHEDFAWLEEHRGVELLPNLRYLPNAETVDIGGVIVGGIGGCFGPSNYERPSSSLRGIARRHFTRDEVETICARKDVDILLLHDAPDGIEIVKGPGSERERRYKSNASGLRTAVTQCKPKICFFGHHHVRLDTEVEGVRCVGLNAVGYAGSLVAVRIDENKNVTLMGDWPATVKA